MKKIARKYLAHYVDAGTANAINYVRLGKDLEEYDEELNPDVEVKQNIWGEQTVEHSGYQVQSEVETYYAYEDDPLFDKLAEAANERLTDGVPSTKVDVLSKVGGEIVWAYREDVYLIPSKLGGDTSGVRIAFTVYNAGNRVKGSWDIATKTFTPEAASTGTT